MAALPVQRGRSVANESKQMAKNRIIRTPDGSEIELVNSPFVMTPADITEGRALNEKVEARMQERAKAYAQSRGETYVAPAPTAPTFGPANGPALAKLGWRQEIMTSPEAKGRDNAVAEILVKHNPEALPARSAIAFLRGLPLETEQPKATTMTNIDPKAARRAEIALSMQAFNRESGYAAKPLAPEHARVLAARAERDNPAMLKRKAEIRLAALSTRDGARRSEEQKALAYALNELHGNQGMPLTKALAKLGVDTSKFMR